LCIHFVQRINLLMSTQESFKEEEHFSEDKLLDYLNIDLDFDEMNSVELHVRTCSTCKKALHILEPRSNKKMRDAEFDQINAIFNKAEIKSRPFRISAKLLITLFFIVIAGVSFALYKKGYIAMPLEQWNRLEASFFENDSNLESEPEVQVIDTLVAANQDTLWVNESENSEVEMVPIKSAAPVVAQQQMPKEQAQQVPKAIINEPVEVHVAKESTNDPVPITEEAKEEPDTVMVSVGETLPQVAAPISKGSVVAVAVQSKQPVPQSGLGNFNSYLATEFVYPEQAKQNQIEGSVVVQFVVDNNGAVNDLKIIQSLGHGCDAVAKSLIQKGPSWKIYLSDDFVEYKTATVEFVFKL